MEQVDYRKYLKAMDQSIEELKIFEIGSANYQQDGSRGRDPIIETCIEREARNIIYRGISEPGKSPYRLGEDDPLWYRKTARELIQNNEQKRIYLSPSPTSYQQTKEIRSLFQLIVPWDAKDIPYPFPDNSFDEFHCHMVNDKIILSRDTKAMPPEDSKWNNYHTIDEFVQEISRITRSDGRVYLTIDNDWFFVDGSLVFGMLELAYSFKMQDFTINLFQFSHNVICKMAQELPGLKYNNHEITEVYNSFLEQRNSQRRNEFPVSRISIDSLSVFTQWSGMANGVLIATK